MFLKILGGGKLPSCLPLVAGSASKTCFRGGQNVCSFTLHLTIKNVFENFGRGKIAQLPSLSLQDLLAKPVIVTLKEELQMSGILSNTVNKTMLVFANLFTVNTHHT